ncbi:YihY/virulence factor BrkB family protein [Microbacterium luticocti]|uniref:YihY/virulence factor BrkB family protein n=1 Tax=Microbacterium luticocti TaxID=451764 RepID=UPI001FDF28AB|nr:YihY/virulence factor BrkB family protein [Microbacterium luticocti]
MTDERAADPARGVTAPLPVAAPPDDQRLRERWEAAQARATALTRRTLAWFPVRVWRHFLRHNGFLLAASISYQSLFSIFAVIYVVFAGLGVWVGASERAVQRVIDLLNAYIPGLIAEHGLATPEQVRQIASSSGGVLAVTGAVAVVVAIWTAVGFVTFTRRAVRDIFDLPFDPRNYVLLKARDLMAAAIFGVALIVGAALGGMTSGALDALLALVGLRDQSMLSQVLVRLLTAVVAFAVNSAALASLFRFLAGTSLPWRTIWPGALLGGAAVAVLQVGIGLLLSYSPTNPLLATFSVLIAFLLWFRLVGIVILVSASWIAVAAHDRDIPLQEQSETDRLRAEHEALLLAGRIRLRDAQVARRGAPWYRRWSADRAVRAAEDELARVQASAPPSAAHRPVGGPR